MTTYRKDFDETKYRSFLITDNELLKEYKEIWKKVSNAIKKEFDSNLVYIKKYLRTKIKSYKGKINKNFCNNKIPKEGSQYICLSVVLLDSIFKTDKKYYPQVFFWRNVSMLLKKKKIYNYITDNAEICSDSDEDNSDEEIIEKIQTKKKILMKKILAKIVVKKILVKKSLMKKYYQKLPDYGRIYYLAHKK